MYRTYIAGFFKASFVARVWNVGAQRLCKYVIVYRADGTKSGRASYTGQEPKYKNKNIRRQKITMKQVSGKRQKTNEDTKRLKESRNDVKQKKNG
jgi:hypothetical protein